MGKLTFLNRVEPFLFAHGDTLEPSVGIDRKMKMFDNHQVSKSMDLLHMDIHPRVNEFMHLSLSKVSQKHFRHVCFPSLICNDCHRQLAGRGI